MAVRRMRKSYSLLFLESLLFEAAAPEDGAERRLDLTREL